jgi:hypothetical protein
MKKIKVSERKNGARPEGYSDWLKKLQQTQGKINSLFFS